MPDDHDTTEGVAEHSSKLQPSINLHTPSYSLYVQLLWYPMYRLPRKDECSGKPCAAKPYSILAPTRDSNPGGRIQNHKRWPLHYHCTLKVLIMTFMVWILLLIRGDLKSKINLPSKVCQVSNTCMKISGESCEGAARTDTCILRPSSARFMFVFGGNTHNDTSFSQGAKCVLVQLPRLRHRYWITDHICSFILNYISGLQFKL